MTTMPVSLDGYTDLPPGKIANVVTFLERTKRPGGPAPLPTGMSVVPVVRPSAGWYRAIYLRIGAEWLWFSRAMMADDVLFALLAKPTTAILALERAGTQIGLAELDFSVPGDAEIVSFGLLPEAFGTGAAQALMASTLAGAFAAGDVRVWLHTCTFDHPAALSFYRRQGFRAYKFAIEISDDPRLTGHLPETAAPRVPLIRPARKAP